MMTNIRGLLFAALALLWAAPAFAQGGYYQDGSTRIPEVVPMVGCDPTTGKCAGPANASNPVPVTTGGGGTAVLPVAEQCPVGGCTAPIGTVLLGPPVWLGVNSCISACTNVAVLPATATQGMQSLQLQVTSAGTGVTAILEGSNDRDCPSATNWSASGIGMAGAVANPTASSLVASNLSFVGVITAPITTNCIRVFITAYSSGNYTIQGWLSPAKSNVDSVLGPVSLYATPGNALQVGQASAGSTGALAPALAATANVSNYVCHIDITSSGTAAAALFAVTLTGLQVGTLTFEYWAPTTGQGVFERNFSPCLRASTTNTAITLNMPALGTGTSAAAADITGFQY